MRDPERIPEFMETIQEMWERHPDWRFGQLIFNVFDGIWDTTEPKFFYIEDDQLLKVIEHRMEEGW